jgi:hypothetical protein
MAGLALGDGRNDIILWNDGIPNFSHFQPLKPISTQKPDESDFLTQII